MNNLKKIVCGTASVIAVAVASSAALAADDVIIVTATKRPTTLQETPVAVSVIGADDLKDSQIRDVRDLQLLAPSLTVVQQQSSSQTVFSIRGIGTSGNNAGLEPSVGVFVDGVYRSRQGAAINDFPTVERIEVLRGPQSTLYGRNTPAGVISIVTQKPEFEIGADAEATYGNYNQVILKGSLTGPVSENIAFRISGNVNKRDGFLENVTTGEDVNDRDRWALRGQLLIEPSDRVSIRLIGDYSKIDENCCAAPFFVNNPTNAFVLGTILGANILPATPFEREVAFNGPLLTQQETFGFSGEVNIDLGYAELTSITAYRDFDEANDIDSDFVDLPLSLINQNRENYNTFTQELRLTSTGDNRLDWMLGAFYFNQNLTHDRTSTFGPTLRPFADIASGGAVTQLETILTAFGAATPGSFLANGVGLQQELFTQDDESIAVFGTLDYHLTDSLTVTGGIRWESETKDVISDVQVTGPFLALDLTNVPQLAFVPAGIPDDPMTAFDESTITIPVGAFAGLSPFQFFPNPFNNFNQSRTDDQVSYLGRIAYDVTDNLNIYGSYSTGFKSGGFNLSAGSSVSARDFAPETTRSFEIGAKSSLFDGAMTVNVALFDQKVTDFQANIFNGTSFDLTNAGERKIQGFEFETVINPFENLILTGGVTYLDAEFPDFVSGSCVSSGFIDDTNIPPELLTCSPTVSGVANPAFTNTRDFSGQPDLGVPKVSAVTTATWIIPMGELEGYVRGEYQYGGKFNAGGDQNPLKLVPSQNLLNASFGIGNPDQGWQLVGWVKNITKEEFAQGIFDSVAQPGSLSGYPNDPRTYGATVRLSF
jgi:iron complex outermembrane recepter protein